MHTPITLGAYKLDGEDEERVKVQLVLSELRKVEKLEKKFCGEVCTGEDGDREGERDGGVYLAVKAFLRTRLKERSGRRWRS